MTDGVHYPPGFPTLGIELDFLIPARGVMKNVLSKLGY